MVNRSGYPNGSNIDNNNCENEKKLKEKPQWHKIWWIVWVLSNQASHIFPNSNWIHLFMLPNRMRFISTRSNLSDSWIVRFSQRTTRRSTSFSSRCTSGCRRVMPGRLRATSCLSAIICCWSRSTPLWFCSNVDCSVYNRRNAQILVNVSKRLLNKQCYRH